MSTVPLALLLLRASRWFDRQLLDRLTTKGWPALSPAQSLVFAHLDPEGVPPAELARRLGTSRQATQDLVAGLVAHGLLVVLANPSRRGGRLVMLTDRGRGLAGDAGQILAGLEQHLGPQRVTELRELLADIGDPAADRTVEPATASLQPTEAGPPRSRS